MDPFKVTVDDETAAILSRILDLDGFFPEFKAEHVSQVFPHSELVFYPSGYRLVNQGDTGRDVFIICSGTVSILKVFGGAGAELARLQAPDIFGEIALLKEGVRTATAEAAGDCRIFHLVPEDIQYLLKENRALVEHLRKLAEERLSRG